MRHIATFCGQCNCGCPELYLDDTAAPEQRVECMRWPRRH